MDEPAASRFERVLGTLPGELRRPTASSAASFSRGDPGAGPLPDDGPLELRDAAEDVEDQSAPRCARVDGFGQALERDAALVQILNGLDELVKGSGQAVQMPDNQRVTGAAIIEGGGELGPCHRSSGHQENPIAGQQNAIPLSRSRRIAKADRQSEHRWCGSRSGDVVIVVVVIVEMDTD